jgi:hypothetical protein
MTGNDELLAAFSEFLQIDSYCNLASKFGGLASMRAIVHEFAEAIGPIKLAESTERDIRGFIARRKPGVIPRSLPIKLKLEHVQSALRYQQCKLAMVCWRLFRRQLETGDDVLHTGGVRENNARRHP